MDAKRRKVKCILAKLREAGFDDIIKDAEVDTFSEGELDYLIVNYEPFYFKGLMGNAEDEMWGCRRDGR